jgi:phage terminase small subunit
MIRKKKLTPKQEGFCQDYITTGSQTRAYQLNYNVKKMLPVTINNKAYELRMHDDITARINELQAMVSKKFEVTVESLTKEFEEDRQLARELDMPSAAIAATNGKARIHGLDKQVISNDPANPMPAIIKVEVIHK